MSDAPRTTEKRWTKAHEEVIVASVLLVGFLFLFFRMDSFITGREGTHMSPAFWPTVLVGLGALFSVGYLIHAVRDVRSGSDGSVDAEEADPADHPEAVEDDGRRYVGKTIAAVALIALYIWLMGPIGFIPATVVFTVGFLLLAGERRWWVLTAFPILASWIVILGFTQLLSVPLPRGEGFFLTLSTYLY